MAKLTTSKRKALPKSAFAVPSTRSKSGGKGGYPIPDHSHAINALARVSQFGTASQKAQVKRAVKKHFPDIMVKKGKK